MLKKPLSVLFIALAVALVLVVLLAGPRLWQLRTGGRAAPDAVEVAEKLSTAPPISVVANDLRSPDRKATMRGVAGLYKVQALSDADADAIVLALRQNKTLEPGEFANMRTSMVLHRQAIAKALHRQLSEPNITGDREAVSSIFRVSLMAVPVSDPSAFNPSTQVPWLLEKLERASRP